MAKLPINDVLAANLKHFMRDKNGNAVWTQASLAKKSGVAQRTIGNYLKPALRQAESKSGKAPSAKLTELEKICEAMGIEVWELLRPITPTEREFYRQVEESFARLRKIAPKEQVQEPAQHPSMAATEEHPA
jgi:transcriptional regulator with XRE-family HTH domain